MITLPDGRAATFITESEPPPLRELIAVDDSLSADGALRMLENGSGLLWTGDYRNGRALLAALKRRLKGAAAPAPTPDAPAHAGALWHAERAGTRHAAELLGGLLVTVESTGSLTLKHSPETQVAIEQAWGPASGPRLISFNTLVGALSAAEWTRQGIEVPGLTGRLTPSYGVFSPTRHVYVRLIAGLDVAGRTVLDVGCGTGVLAFVLLQRGARAALGSDLDPRAVQCAQRNAVHLGLTDRFRAVEADLFPEGERADTIVFNAPWIPERPRTRLDRTVFDEGGETVRRFLAGVSDHLLPGGVAALVLSDLPERLGLRADGAVEAMIEAAELELTEIHDAPASHRRSNRPDDPLHVARAGERIRLFLVKPRSA